METEGSSTKQKLSNPLITLKTYSIRAINDLLEVSGALQNKSFWFETTVTAEQMFVGLQNTTKDCQASNDSLNLRVMVARNNFNSNEKVYTPNDTKRCSKSVERLTCGVIVCVSFVWGILQRD